MYGGPGDDQVLGGDGRNFFRALCDRLHGGPGNDRSPAVAGRDRMSGGPRATTSRPAAAEPT